MLIAFSDGYLKEKRVEENQVVKPGQQLMQVIPRFHQDKLPEGTGDRPLLDPAIACSW